MTETTIDAPTTPSPPERRHGLGEVIRSARLYTGLSQRGMAKRLNDMDRRTYQRIETGDDPCPAGLLDTVREVLERFDAEVDRAIKAAEAHGTVVEVVVPMDPREEWTRAVIDRASVLDERGLLVPVQPRDYNADE